MKHVCCSLLLLFGLMSPLWAQDRFVVEDIRVEGLQRISAGTVFTYLPVGVGDAVDAAGFPEVIRTLFQTGFFDDVSLARDGNVLVVQVVERPAIAEIVITGNRDISSDDLRRGLRDIGLAEGEVFDRALLERVEQELLRQYFNRARYAVRIDTRTRNLPRNRVAIEIDISEGAAARISRINIVGNQAFGDRDLLREFQLRTPGWFTFFTKADQYSREKLTGDLEALNSFYLDRGYLQFNVDSAQVSISPDKRDVYITINITEGARYNIGRIDLDGDLRLPEAELRELITIREGDVFSRTALGETTRTLADRLGQDGYAFAGVNPVPDIDEAAQRVDVTFVVDPGERVYVRRINFAGNIKTQDDVLRREMRQTEGTWIATPDVERSRERLQRLEYLAAVAIESEAVPGTTDQVDLNVTVEERPSGSVTFGVGYGQTEGVLLNFGLQQSNFLGTGNEFSFVFNNSSADTRYGISYNNPFYTPDGVSRGFRLNYEETDARELNRADYAIDRLDGQVFYGFPLNETDTLRVGIGAEDLRLKTTARTPEEIVEFLDDRGRDFLNFTAEASLARDTRNRLIFPDLGSLNRISLDVTLPGSDAEFYRLSLRHLSYYPLTDNLTAAIRGTVGYGDGYGSTGALPFWERFFAGGLRTVRGFRANTLGPRFQNDEPAGGDLLVAGGVDVLSPLPFLDDSANFRVGAFFDAGNVYESPGDFDAGELRYSVGVSFQWISPLGPLVFSLAEPLNDKTGDNLQRFQFSFGVPF